MDDDVESIREELSGDTIYLHKVNDCTGIFDQVDAFVNLSRDNETIRHVFVCLDAYPADNDASGPHRYAIWDKIAQGIGNLQALREIRIVDANFVDDDEGALVPDWKIMACILQRLRRGVHLRMLHWRADAQVWDAEALQVFARVIRGRAMITGFITRSGFPFHYLDILCSALLTLPALTNVSFGELAGQGPEEGQSLESMVKLLQSPTLRKVEFESVVFTSTLCQALAKALKERSEITNLRFRQCSFPESGSAEIARALKTNTALKCLHLLYGADEFFCEVLTTVLLSNSTLQELAFDGSGRCSWLSQLFLALQVNVGLKVLEIHGFELTDEKVSTAMRLGVGNNSTLEALHLFRIKSGDNDTRLWREALSFLRTNRALKTLSMHFDQNVTESHATAIRMEAPAALCKNESLDSLHMVSPDARFDDYLSLVEAIQSNTTLKSLWLRDEDFDVDEDETKDLIPVLTKNYGLEEFLGLEYESEDVNAILKLNQAGRRYLVQDGSSISKGVAVLSRVNDDINPVFFHLLENPRLCNRSAVEMSSSSIGNMDNAGSASPGKNSGGKRGQQPAPSHTGMETRRRLE
jgi:hypothetical protein